MRATSYRSASLLVFLSLPVVAFAATPRPTLEIEAQEQPADGGHPLPAITAAEDTLWIADWSFESGGRCNHSGWTRYDNRILNDGSNYWSVSSSHAGTGGITGSAAVLRKHDLAWARDGYGNDWDYSIVLKYTGASTLSFDFVSDTEPGFDFVQVEADSAGASEARVNYSTNPMATPIGYRTVLFAVDGPQSGSVVDLALPDFGIPSLVHEVYIRFISNSWASDEDGGYLSAFNVGLVVDNVTVTGGLSYTEDFECGSPGCLNPNVHLVNSALSTPFGLWARLWPHPPDNDACEDDRTCAWIFSDPSLPAYSPEMAFGPLGAVVRNWLDNVIVSPWVSLSGLPPYGATLLSFRRFPGSSFANGKIVQSWRVRSRVRVENTDTSIPGDSIDVATPWAHTISWNSLNLFKWITVIADMSPYISSDAREIQVSFRVTDWRIVAGLSPLVTLDTGPGPYLDRVRIGRPPITGPSFSQATSYYGVAADGFPSARNAIAPGENFSPTADRFGTVDFASPMISLGSGGRVGQVATYNTMDSIAVSVSDARMTGALRVQLFVAIVSGPHAGKAPPPLTVGANGFFAVDADSVRTSGGDWLPNRWFADLDDEYFRGGDEIVYFWAATDAAGGFSSWPQGLAGVPHSVAEAQGATGGLCEFEALPAIDWDPAYLARVAAHPGGKIDPTPTEIANSHQRTNILYVWQRPWARRSGEVHRTAFMHTLDQLGYRDLYDRYFIPKSSAIYLAHLGGRASVEQATGYSLIIQDSHRQTWNVLPPPDYRERPVPQVQWYRDWLARASMSEAGRAALWLLGDEFVASEGNNPLVQVDMGVTVAHAPQTLYPFPEIAGQSVFTWANGHSTNFTGDRLVLLNSECKALHRNTGLTATGTAVVTHLYTLNGALGDGAMVMNANPSDGWNTILGSFSWEDLVDSPGSPPGNGEAEWLEKILAGVLPDSIRALAQPTDANDPAFGPPRVTTLHQNVPNPFNPVTTIRFDLARGGRVTLHVYDVTGRRVRTLLDKTMPAGWNHQATWNGQDENGRRVASGIYLYRLSAGDFTRTMKMVVLK